jgi:hypothetical protein
MPKARAQPKGILSWVFLAALVGAIAYLVLTEPKTSAVIGALLIIGYLAIRPGIKRQEMQLRELAASRKGQSICDFAREFDLRTVDSWIVRAVYEQVQRQLARVHPEFPLHADDLLKEELRLEDDDLDLDVVIEVEERTGRSLDNATSNPYFGKVRTVRDLVLFFQAQARRGAA